MQITISASSPSNKQRSSNSPTTEDTNFDVNLEDDTETPFTFAQSLEGKVRYDLTNTATGQILLITVWINGNACRKLDMYPEFVSINDTGGNNAEE